MNIDTVILILILVIVSLTYLRGFQMSGHTRRTWNRRVSKAKTLLRRKD